MGQPIRPPRPPGAGPLPRRATRVALGLWALPFLMLGACGAEPDTGSEPASAPAASVHLLDRLAGARIEGLAAVLVAGVEPAAERRLLAADFEDGGLGPLAPFFGLPGDAPGADTRRGPAPGAELVRVIGGERAFAGGRSVQLRGGVAHGVSLRSPPLPVSPEERYRLRYRVALDGVGVTAPEVPRGQVTLLFYRLAPGEAAAAAEVLADPERERERRIASPREIALAHPPQSSPWRSEELEFGAGPRATHLVLSLDLSRPADDRGPHRATGVARFDDVELTVWREPAPQRHRAGGAPAAGPGSLVLAATLAHPAHPDATETRPALAAPAPSAFAFPVEVPGDAALSLAVGLLPEAEIPGAPGLDFVVELADAAGQVHTLLRERVVPGARPGWRDAELDLAAFAGQRVEVRLSSEPTGPDTGPAEKEGAAALSRLPDAGALFADPTLVRRGSPGRLALLVGIDSVAASRSSTFGHPRRTTPNLTALAAEGVLFRRAVAPSPWTLPSFASILTGLAAEEHAAGEPVAGRGLYRPLAPEFRTVAERLREVGWETRAWVNNPNLTASFGLAQGFGSWIDYGTRDRDEASQQAVGELLDYAERSRGRDRFVFFHVLEPHGPYPAREELRRRFAASPEAARPLDAERFLAWSSGREAVPEAERGRLADLYAASLADADEQIGRIAEAAKRLAGAEEVVLAVTSDHGEELFEHGLYEHGHSLVEELLHVPLVVFAPRITPRPRVVESPVAAHDVAATFLALAGLEAASGVGAARSLLPALRGEGDEPGRTLFASRNLYGVQRLAARRGDAKYVYNQYANGRPVRRSPRPPTRHELHRIGPDGQEGPDRTREDAALARELHEALAPLFASALDGSYVVSLDGGDRRRRLAGSLVLPRGSAWHPGPRDFVWPGRDGAEAPLEIRVRSRGGRERVDFRVEAERALLAFPLLRGGGPVGLSLSLDGAAAVASQVALGGGAALPGLPATLDDAALWVSAEALLARRPAGSPVLVGRVVERAGRRDAGADAPADAGLRRQLEALGYVEE